MRRLVGLQGKIKVCVKVLGCRSNLYEGDYIAGELKARGAVITDDFNGAGAAVIMSCSVTEEADRKCRQLIRRARRLLGSDGILAVCGCWAQGINSEAARELGINILTGNRNKDILPDLIAMQINNGAFFQDLRNDNKASPSGGFTPLEWGVKLGSEDDNEKWTWEELGLHDRPLMHTRAFIKIQDGCNHFCSYCIIPFLRGRPVSRPLDNIINEVKKVIASGCREIVLTGIHLGMYGRDINSSLADVIIALNKIKGLERLRMGSLEPFSLDKNLLKVLSESEIFCPHLHLPLQSGDDNILSLMRRGYTASDFQRICDTARKYLGEDLHISSDILVGFPAESCAAFENTLKLMRSAGLGRVHVFPFSPRRGTLAEKLNNDNKNKVPDKIKSERVNAAINLGRELLKNYAKKFAGFELDILVEEIFEFEAQNILKGHTPHFLEAEVTGFKGELSEMKNKIVRAKVKSINDETLSLEAELCRG